MEFISKYNMTFILFVDKKYGKKFKDFEQYSMYLFELNRCSDKEYYYQLEQDIREYSNYQLERKSSYGKSKS